jgi:hypothetical protein
MVPKEKTPLQKMQEGFFFFKILSNYWPHYALAA